MSLRLLPVIAALAALLAGCPEARPPIDRTQANAIPKALFDGEWYFQRTIVDVPYETEFTFIGDQGELDRIRWRIEETMLVAVRSYQRITDSDPDLAPDGEYEGSPSPPGPSRATSTSAATTTRRRARRRTSSSRTAKTVSGTSGTTSAWTGAASCSRTGTSTRRRS